mmetsp:Transcript_78461/g.204608  ORF Transcript_78461/g.204608 Transcript_78461/m.204608 type:complete len:551 (+) Transcript_78461:483-2135(+)
MALQQSLDVPENYGDDTGARDAAEGDDLRLLQVLQELLRPQQLLVGGVVPLDGLRQAVFREGFGPALRLIASERQPEALVDLPIRVVGSKPLILLHENFLHSLWSGLVDLQSVGDSLPRAFRESQHVCGDAALRALPAHGLDQVVLHPHGVQDLQVHGQTAHLGLKSGLEMVHDARHPDGHEAAPVHDLHLLLQKFLERVHAFFPRLLAEAGRCHRHGGAGDVRHVEGGQLLRNERSHVVQTDLLARAAQEQLPSATSRGDGRDVVLDPGELFLLGERPVSRTQGGDRLGPRLVGVPPLLAGLLLGFEGAQRLGSRGVPMVEHQAALVLMLGREVEADNHSHDVRHHHRVLQIAPGGDLQQDLEQSHDIPLIDAVNCERPHFDLLCRPLRVHQRHERLLESIVLHLGFIFHLQFVDLRLWIPVHFAKVLVIVFSHRGAVEPVHLDPVVTREAVYLVHKDLLEREAGEFFIADFNHILLFRPPTMALVRGGILLDIQFVYQAGCFLALPGRLFGGDLLFRGRVYRRRLLRLRPRLGGRGCPLDHGRAALVR